MKKIFTILAMASAAAVVLASCNKNQPPVFDDSNAFVGFGSIRVSLSEESDSILIPVSLASVSGLNGSITFKVFADTTEKDGVKYYPQEGINYEIFPEGGTLKFDSKNRTQNIKVIGKYFPEYTGDLSFRIALTSQTKGISLGTLHECKVVLNDIDHPLTPILGAYTASAEDYFSGPSSWTMNLTKDPDDASKVWIDDWANLGGNAKALGPIYGNVDATMTKITIPFGQTLAYVYQGEPTLCLGLDSGLGGYDGGSTTATIEKDPVTGKVKRLVFDSAWGFWAYGSGGAAFGLVCPEDLSGVPFVAVKK